MELPSPTPLPDPPAQPAHDARAAAWTRLALLVILAAAACLRGYRIGGRSLWIDEMYTHLSVTGWQFRAFVATPHNQIVPNPPPLTDISRAKPWWTTLRPDTDDIHPPLYFFLTRLWTAIFGTEAGRLRALAAVFSVLAVALMYATVSEWSGPGPGLAAAAIMAVAQPQVRMAQEARSYAMVLATALAAAWLVARIERRGVRRGRVILLALMCLLMPLAHYFSLTVVATLALYAIVRLGGDRRRAVLAATLGATALFALAWSPVLDLQAHGVSGRGTAVFIDASPHHYRATWARLALLPVRFLYEPLPSDRAVSMIFAGVCLLPLLLVRRRPDLLPWLIWLPVNVAPALLNDLTHPSWTLQIERYTFFATPALFALIAVLGTSLRPPWRYLLAALAVVGCALHVEQAYFLNDRTTQDWRRLGHMYRELARPGDLTVFASTAQPSFDEVYYLCVGHYVYPFPGPVALLNRPPSPELLAAMRRYPGVLVVGDARAAQTYVPGARAVDLRGLPLLGAVTRLEFPTSGPTPPLPTTAAGSTSRTAPTSPAATAPRR